MNSGIVAPVFVKENGGRKLRIELAAAEFDSSYVLLFKDMIKKVWSREIEEVEIDCEKVSFIDSPAIGAWLSLYRRLGRSNSLKIVNPNQTVAKTIELFGHRDVFSVEFRDLSSSQAG